jgi:hypothetical protein
MLSAMIDGSFREIADDLVGRRAGRAALRCKQFDDGAGLSVRGANDGDDRTDAESSRPERAGPT